MFEEFPESSARKQVLADTIAKLVRLFMTIALLHHTIHGCQSFLIVISTLKSAVISQQLSTSTNPSTKDVTERLFPLGFTILNLLFQHLGMKLRSISKEDILELQRHHGVY